MNNLDGSTNHSTNCLERLTGFAYKNLQEKQLSLPSKFPAMVHLTKYKLVFYILTRYSVKDY